MGDESKPGDDALRLEGTLTISRLGSAQRAIDQASDPLIIDVSGIERMDTVGAWLLHRTREQRGAAIVGESPLIGELLQQVAEADPGEARTRPDNLPWPFAALGDLGAWATDFARTTRDLVGFFGAVLVSIGTTLRYPRRFRMNAVIQRFDVVGVRALGIIGLMSFLIGIVIGQQGAVQLRQFGAEVYTVNLIGRLTLRELGPLMTAIMVAGRSGSAFAAQLGTMKITEEIDAMRTIGVSPIEALVLPRLFAVVIMMVLLSFFSIVSALVGGGLFVWVALETPPLTYLQRLQEVTPMTDLLVGLIKAPVFGFIIGLAGCYNGLQVHGNSEEVGYRTTTAVVQSIFLVIVLDAVFAVFFSQVGWI